MAWMWALFLTGVERDLDLVSGGVPDRGETERGETCEEMHLFTTGLAVTLNAKGKRGKWNHIKTKV